MNNLDKKDTIIFSTVIVCILINIFFEKYCEYEKKSIGCCEFLVINQDDPPQSALTSPDVSLNYMVASGTTASTVSTSEIFIYNSYEQNNQTTQNK